MRWRLAAFSFVILAADCRKKTARSIIHGDPAGAARDEEAEAIILRIAAAALLCLSRNPDGRFEDALEEAATLWAGRIRSGS